MTRPEGIWRQLELQEARPVEDIPKPEVHRKPAKPLLFDGKAIAKFNRLFQRGNPDECWLWKGWKFKSGYGGFIACRSDKFRSHRVAYAIFIGPIPDGKEVCHRCDTPACVNPNHLFLGDHQANMTDAKQKGRIRAPHGEAQGHSRWTKHQVVCMRLLHQGGMRISQVARMFNGSNNGVAHILNRDSWKHVA